MISQPEIAASNRRKKLKEAWKSPTWKQQKKEFLEGKCCAWCGSTTKLVPHHPYIQSYKDGVYLDFYLSGCIVLCTRCHFALHKGLKLCPKCKIKFMRHDSEMCYECYLRSNPVIAEQIEIKKAQQKKRQKELRQKAYRKAKARADSLKKK